MHRKERAKTRCGGLWTQNASGYWRRSGIRKNTRIGGTHPARKWSTVNQPLTSEGTTGLKSLKPRAAGTNSHVFCVCPPLGRPNAGKSFVIGTFHAPREL